MEVILKDTFKINVQNAILIGKETGCIITFIRDGEHGTADLSTVLAFQEAGFDYHIKKCDSRHDDEDALKVEFYYKGSPQTQK